MCAEYEDLIHFAVIALKVLKGDRCLEASKATVKALA
jgi:hypothetical protein